MTYDILILLGFVILIGISSSAGKQPEKISPIKPIKRFKETQPIRKVKHIKTALSQNHRDAILGLQSLGFSHELASLKVRELPNTMTVEDMIKQGLVR